MVRLAPCLPDMATLARHYDYARRPGPPLAAWLLLAAGGLALALGVWRYQEVRAAIAQRQAQVQAARPVPRAQAVPALDSEDSEELARAQLLLDRDWPALFHTLESVPAKDIALLSIAAYPGRNRVVLEGEARSPQAMLAYLQALQNAGPLRPVRLVRHEVRQDVAEHPLKFQLDAGWP